ncbi:MAG: BofC C-terminal domain-containing protein [Clostridia bacterium]|nr:BofC C-terminal domain-containing protein [Clostridia bacterium]
MKYKKAIGIMLVLIFIVCIGIGNYIYKINEISNINIKSITEVSNQKVTDECTKEGEELIQTNWTEKKVSPNATFIYKLSYKKCGHTIKKYDTAPQITVNNTKEELEKIYSDWTIESFSNNEVVLSKTEEGMCDEHYVLKNEEGQVAIYTIKENGEENVLERTGIIIKYLPEEDQKKLKEGIRIDGHEELNRYLEDYE